MALPMRPARQRNSLFLESLVVQAKMQPGPQIRKIDLVEGRREIPMKILCLGYSRTGTLSLFTALHILGYKPYHMAEAIKNADVDLECWNEGVDDMISQKAGVVGHGEGQKEGKCWGKVEFDKLMGHCDAAMDIPCILFAEELIAAYPEAKVILTERPVEGWLKSMKNTVGKGFSHYRWRLCAWADSDLANPLYRLVGQTLLYRVFDKADFSPDSKAAQVYAEHNALVRRLCPPENLLVFKLGSGWKPLCDFLGAEMPPSDVPYPNVNDTNTFIYVHKKILARATLWATIKVTTGVGSVGLIAGAAWYWARTRS